MCLQTIVYKKGKSIYILTHMCTCKSFYSDAEEKLTTRGNYHEAIKKPPLKAINRFDFSIYVQSIEFKDFLEEL